MKQKLFDKLFKICSYVTATCWTVWGSNPSRAKFSASIQTGPEAMSSCTMGTGTFPGVKLLGNGVDHPPPSSAKVKERVEL
jgi:hypothetical protein